jgi:hypothetical protein
MAIFVFLNLESGEDEEMKVVEAVNEAAARLQLPDSWNPIPRHSPTLTHAGVWSKHEAAVDAVMTALERSALTAEREKLRAHRTKWAHVAACLLGVTPV